VSWLSSTVGIDDAPPMSVHLEGNSRGVERKNTCSVPSRSLSRPMEFGWAFIASDSTCLPGDSGTGEGASGDMSTNILHARFWPSSPSIAGPLLRPCWRKRTLSPQAFTEPRVDRPGTSPGGGQWRHLYFWMRLVRSQSQCRCKTSEYFREGSSAQSRTRIV